VLAGAAANPDARSLLRKSQPTPVTASPEAGTQASANGHHRRTTVDEDLEPDGGRTRRRWPVVTSILGVLVVLVVGGLFIGYRITQGQYYVATDGSTVTIYRGISEQIAGLHLSSVYQRTSIPARAVPADLQLPTTPSSLTKAKQTVRTIGQYYTCQQKQTQLQAWDTVEAAYQRQYRAWQQAMRARTSRTKTKAPAQPKAPTQPKPVVPQYCSTLGAG
jgi:protein phosphatase